MNVKVVLACGLALVAIAVALVLSEAPSRVAGTNSVPLRSELTHLRGGEQACQSGEVLPAATSAIRIYVEATIGPSVSVEVLSAGRVLTRGTHDSGWEGAEVTVPVGRLRRSVSDATVCFALGQSREAVIVLGQQNRTSTALTSAGGRVRGRMRIDYIAPGSASWWSMAKSVARRIGLGRAPSGTWIALLIGALMVAVTALASRLAIQQLTTRPRPRPRPRASDHALRMHVLRRPPRRLARIVQAPRNVPRAAWACAVIACVNAACWSLLSPPFQTPDEPSHFAYVQYLAEARRLPLGAEVGYSPQENVVLRDLDQSGVAYMPSAQTISSRAQQQRLEHDLALPLSARGAGDTGTSANEPPLYYVLETVPYELGSGGTLLDRLELMRLLSALFAGVTAMFAFLFVRETLPEVGWAWTVGGLGVALAPLLGFMSGAVNPDAMLTAVSAVLFYLLARAFRRGLTLGLAIAIGAAMAIGSLTKLNFLGLFPGAAIGLLLAALRPAPKARHVGYAAFGLVLAVSPALVYLAFKPLTTSTSLSLVSNSAGGAARGDVLSEISYVWQLFLPRLPGSVSYFPGLSTPRQLWFNGFVGVYGWADTTFPGWVYDIALVPAGLLALLCMRAFVAGRAVLGSRLPELVVYLVMAAGVMAMVGAASYTSDVIRHEGPFYSPRYLLPMLALLGAALALAARGAGRRWGPAVGAMVVVLILAHDLFSQLLVVSRYYG